MTHSINSFNNVLRITKTKIIVTFIETSNTVFHIYPKSVTKHPTLTSQIMQIFVCHSFWIYSVEMYLVVGIHCPCTQQRVCICSTKMSYLNRTRYKYMFTDIMAANSLILSAPNKYTFKLILVQWNYVKQNVGKFGKS